MTASEQHHGDYDSQQQKWFCGYWMSQEEWFDIHDYAPSKNERRDETTNEDCVEQDSRIEPTSSSLATGNYVTCQG